MDSLAEALALLGYSQTQTQPPHAAPVPAPTPASHSASAATFAPSVSLRDPRTTLATMATSASAQNASSRASSSAGRSGVQASVPNIGLGSERSVRSDRGGFSLGSPELGKDPATMLGTSLSAEGPRLSSCTGLRQVQVGIDDWKMEVQRTVAPKPAASNTSAPTANATATRKRPRQQSTSSKASRPSNCTPGQAQTLIDRTEASSKPSNTSMSASMPAPRSCRSTLRVSDATSNGDLPPTVLHSGQSHSQGQGQVPNQEESWARTFELEQRAVRSTVPATPTSVGPTSPATKPTSLATSISQASQEASEEQRRFTKLRTLTPSPAKEAPPPRPKPATTEANTEVASQATTAATSSKGSNARSRKARSQPPASPASALGEGCDPELLAEFGISAVPGWERKAEADEGPKKGGRGKGRKSAAGTPTGGRGGASRGKRKSTTSAAKAEPAPAPGLDATAAASRQQPQTLSISGDELLQRLMLRRAARNAAETEDGKEQPAGNTSIPFGSAGKGAVVEGLTAAHRGGATELLLQQLQELKRVRSAAQASGWTPGCNSDDQQELVPPPSAPMLPRTGARGGGASGGPRRVHPERARHLYSSLGPTVRLQVHPEEAARASDLWVSSQRPLQSEIARAQKRLKGQSAAAPSYLAERAEEEEEEMLWRLQRRVHEEPNRRALMRRHGACPKADVFDGSSAATASRASAAKALEGWLPARCLANEFEAALLLKSQSLADDLQRSMPGFGRWEGFETPSLLDMQLLAGSKDFRSCLDVSQSFGAQARGSDVGRLARCGLTACYPFAVPAGLDHFVCDNCGRLVPRRHGKSHNLTCVGDAAGRARHFTQFVADDLGVLMWFKHVVKEQRVELRLEGQLESAVKRALWSSMWQPLEVRCSWRLARYPPEELPNVFPAVHDSSEASAAPPPAKRRRLREDRVGRLHANDALPDEEDGDHSESDHGSDSEDGEGENCTAGLTSAKLAEPPGPSRLVAKALTIPPRWHGPPCAQPVWLTRPMANEQLRVLAWMKHREAQSEKASTKQVLRQRIAETDVCAEVSIERDIAVRGGILTDESGYSKTLCTLGLVLDSARANVHDELSLHDWVGPASRRVVTNASLLITPPNLFSQWLKELRSSVDPALGLKVLAVPSHSKLKSLTVADFVAADLVLVSFRLFSSEAYQRYFDELCMPGLKVYDEVSVKQREDYAQKRKVSAPKSGKRGATPGVGAEAGTGFGAGLASGDAPVAGARSQGLKRKGTFIQKIRASLREQKEGRSASSQNLANPGDTDFSRQKAKAAPKRVEKGSLDRQQPLAKRRRPLKAEGSGLAPGATVRLIGLVANPELNGAYGQLVSFNHLTKKWVCSLRGRFVNVTEDHLEVVPEAPIKREEEAAEKAQEKQEEQDEHEPAPTPTKARRRGKGAGRGRRSGQAGQRSATIASEEARKTGEDAAEEEREQEEEQEARARTGEGREKGGGRGKGRGWGRGRQARKREGQTHESENGMAQVAPGSGDERPEAQNDEPTGPALHLSKYYLDLRARRDYLPQRYLDLEKRTRRLLKESTPQDLAQSPALLEMFHFRRVFFDEFQEALRGALQWQTAEPPGGSAAAAATSGVATGSLGGSLPPGSLGPTSGHGGAGVGIGAGVSSTTSGTSAGNSLSGSGTSSVAFYTLHMIEGRSLWGLTACPPLGSAPSIAQMATLLHVYLPWHDRGEAQRFLDSWTLSCPSDHIATDTATHVVEVDLSPEEMVLYLHQRNIVAELAGEGLNSAMPSTGGARALAERRLLQLCSCYDVPDSKGTTEPAGDGAPDARTILSKLIQALEDNLTKAVEKQAQCEAEREGIVERNAAREALQSVLPASSWEATLVCAHAPLLDVQRLGEAAMQVTETRQVPDAPLLEGDLRRMAQVAMDGAFVGQGVVPHKNEDCPGCRAFANPDARLRQINRARGQAISEEQQSEHQLKMLRSLLQGFGPSAPAAPATFVKMEDEDEDKVKLDVGERPACSSSSAAADGELGEALLCEACMDEVSLDDLVILPCSHRLHAKCWEQASSSLGKCPLPTCRQQIPPALVVTCTSQLRRAQRHYQQRSLREEDRELRRRFGSKIAKVVERVKAIQISEGDATKIVIFVQFDNIFAKLERALMEAKVPPVLLRGHLAQRQRQLARFSETIGPQASVLLLTLDQSPAGMGLACARHLFFVHPLQADKTAEALENEAQAIGRLRQQGRTDTIQIHRFAARHTVEEAEVRRRVQLMASDRG